MKPYFLRSTKCCSDPPSERRLLLGTTIQASSSQNCHTSRLRKELKQFTNPTLSHHSNCDPHESPIHVVSSTWATIVGCFQADDRRIVTTCLFILEQQQKQQHEAGKAKQPYRLHPHQHEWGLHR